MASSYQDLGFKQKIDDGLVPKSCFPNIQDLLKLEHFDVEIQRKKSNAAAGLTDFIININVYNDINENVEPMRIAAETATNELAQAIASKEAALAAKQEAQALADKLKTVFADGAVIKKRTGPKGDIFGKVTSADVAQLIKDKTQAAVDRRKIKVPDIKGAGSATAELQLHKEVKATLKVVVVAAD